MSYRDKVAARAPAEKEKHPERFCPKCLWRTHMPDGSRRSWCRNHESSEKAEHYAKQLDVAPPSTGGVDSPP
jgi:hypothetical protein